MTHPNPNSQPQAVIDSFVKQVGWSEKLGSPFTSRLLAILLDDIQAGGVTAELVLSWPGDPVSDALPLRLAGALHALVLTKAAPDLAACYPPHETGIEGLRTVLLSAVKEHRNYIRDLLSSPPQTNEVGRSSVLVGGFLQIAQETGLPLRLFEIGASAGLNTVWDRFHYHLGAAEWGDAQSAVRLAPDWQGPPPLTDTPLQVIERRACDLAPIALQDPLQRLRLRAYVWPDQRERLARLEGAIEIASAHGPQVERADAADWVRTQVQPAEGSATVLYHSIMWQYLPGSTQENIKASLERAGRRTTKTAPLAWLRFEPPNVESRSELRLTLWPKGEEFCLAFAGPHGNNVLWSGM